MQRNHPGSSNSSIAAGLFCAIILWGSNNAATKYLVQGWPPVLVGATRFFIAGVIIIGILRWSSLLQSSGPLPVMVRKKLWGAPSIVLAVYLIFFNLAMEFTSASHVALHLGASPVWALLWERRPEWSAKSLQSYGAALLALSGVVILFWPVLHQGGTGWIGEVLAFGSSIFWTAYGRQCRALTTVLTSAEVAACTFWRGGLMVTPIAIGELLYRGIDPDPKYLIVQSYCIIASGVIAFLLWNRGLKYWPTSKVYLFNNLIPLSTTLFAYLFLKEPISPTFGIAMCLILAGVGLGQLGWNLVGRKLTQESS
ncbi:MAG: DMT family transporter [Verrucomicrobiota bacterium]|nr:DMT family transporter [Verrucomicrobiota bacterium]